MYFFSTWIKLRKLKIVFSLFSRVRKVVLSVHNTTTLKKIVDLQKHYKNAVPPHNFLLPYRTFQQLWIRHHECGSQEHYTLLCRLSLRCQCRPFFIHQSLVTVLATPRDIFPTPHRSYNFDVHILHRRYHWPINQFTGSLLVRGSLWCCTIWIR